MGELSQLLREKYFKSNNINRELIQKQRIKVAIQNMLEEYLNPPIDSLTFEVIPRDMPYMAEILEEDVIKNSYEIFQIKETLFVARAREVEL